jgi:hypothetical protein
VRAAPRGARGDAVTFSLALRGVSRPRRPHKAARERARAGARTRRPSRASHAPSSPAWKSCGYRRCELGTARALPPLACLRVCLCLRAARSEPSQRLHAQLPLTEGTFSYRITDPSGTGEKRRQYLIGSRESAAARRHVLTPARRGHHQVRPIAWVSALRKGSWRALAVFCTHSSAVRSTPDGLSSPSL